MSFIAWGNAPGISAIKNLAALKARFRMHQALPRTISSPCNGITLVIVIVLLIEI